MLHRFTLTILMLMSMLMLVLMLMLMLMLMLNMLMLMSPCEQACMDPRLTLTIVAYVHLPPPLREISIHCSLHPPCTHFVFASPQERGAHCMYKVVSF